MVQSADFDLFIFGRGFRRKQMVLLIILMMFGRATFKKLSLG